MRLIKRHYRLVALAAACIALGAGVSAITSAGAATQAPNASTTAAGATGNHRRPGLAKRILGAAVQGDLVVPSKSGFVTVTFNRGVVQSTPSGNQLTITERTKKAIYKTVTLTIPANARVRSNGHKAALSQLTAGERVTVLTTPVRTSVVAHTPRS